MPDNTNPDDKQTEVIANILRGDFFPSAEGLLLRVGEVYEDFDIARITNRGVSYGLGSNLTPNSNLSFKVIAKDQYGYEIILKEDSLFTDPAGNPVTIKANNIVCINRMGARTQFDRLYPEN